MRYLAPIRSQLSDSAMTSQRSSEFQCATSRLFGLNSKVAYDAGPWYAFQCATSRLCGLNTGTLDRQSIRIRRKGFNALPRAYVVPTYC